MNEILAILLYKLWEQMSQVESGAQSTILEQKELVLRQSYYSWPSPPSHIEESYGKYPWICIPED